jgi:hypothetical protein
VDAQPASVIARSAKITALADSDFVKSATKLSLTLSASQGWINPIKIKKTNICAQHIYQPQLIRRIYIGCVEM